MLTDDRRRQWNRAFLAEATFLYNVCDSSVGQVPVTFVDAKVDAIDKDWEAQKTTSPLIHRTLYGPKGVGVWDVNEMDGLPVGIQVRRLVLLELMGW